MKTNKSTSQEDYRYIKNKGKSASEIVAEANNAREKSLESNEWYTNMLHDATLAAKDENAKTLSKTIVGLFDSITRQKGQRDTTPFYLAYFANSYAISKSVRPDKDKPGYYTVLESQRRIDFPTIEKAWREVTDNKAETLAVDGRYAKRVRIFFHYCLCAIGADMSGKGNAVAIPAMNEQEEIDRKNGANPYSMVSLEKRLNEIVADILPASIAPKMRKEDVKAILNALTKAVPNNKAAESKAHLVTINDRAFINFLFRAMELRMNDGTYMVGSKGKIHKAKNESKVIQK